MGKGGTGRAATLKDVARLASVSTATVARVLHNRGYVADETRNRVEAAVEECGYQLNVIAQSLRRQQTFVLGHVLTSIASNPFFAMVANGVEEEAARHGVGVLTVNADEDAGLEMTAVRTLLQRRVDAILFTTAHHESSINLVRSSDIPFVQVERAGLADAHSVTVDNYRGACDAADYLFQLGHQRVGYIGVADGGGDDSLFQQGRHRVERERIAGFREAHDSRGLKVDESLIHLTRSYSDEDFVRAATAQLLQSTPRPSAILAGSDVYASVILQELYRLRLRVPDDISVVGFDDTLSPFLTPALTTVSQPMHELGRTAAILAMKLTGIKSGEDGPVRGEAEVRLSTSLVIRNSTAPVRGER